MKWILAAALLMCTGMVPAAFADDRDIILESCGTALKMTDSACNCIADKVEENFDPKQLAFFLAVIQSDGVEATRLKGNMSEEQLIQVARGMETMPATCAGQ